MATQASTGTAGLFLRKATGLVREVSGLDLGVMNSASMNLGLGIATTFIWAPYLLNGGNILLSIVLTTVLLGLTAAYSYASAVGAMPRSGADYVFVSRVLGPVYGFMFLFQWMIWSFFWMGFNAWAVGKWTLPGFFQVLGELTHNPVLTDLAVKVSSTPVIIGLAILFQIIFALVAIWGTRPYFWYLKGSFIFSAISIVIVILVPLFIGQTFVERWNAFVASTGTGLPYDKVISTAIGAGFNPDQPFSLAKTLAMAPLVFWVCGYFTGSAHISGEVKKPRTSQFAGMVWAMVVNGAVFAIVTIVVERYFGTRFLSSLGYLYYEQPALLNMGHEPNLNFLVSVLSRSAPLVGLIGIGYFFWDLNGTPNFMIKLPRALMAVAFDRMAPEWLGDVSEKTHTPVKATIFSAVLGAVAIVFLILWGERGLPSTLYSKMFELALVSVACIVFPFKFRKLWESTTPGRKIFGIPDLVITGVSSIVVVGAISYFFTNRKMFGASSPVSLGAVGTMILLGAVYYYAYRAYQKRRGINVDLVYKEIPPE